jgi:hypothetical protein
MIRAVRGMRCISNVPSDVSHSQLATAVAGECCQSCFVEKRRKMYGLACFRTKCSKKRKKKNMNKDLDHPAPRGASEINTHAPNARAIAELRSAVLDGGHGEDAEERRSGRNLQLQKRSCGRLKVDNLTNNVGGQNTTKTVSAIVSGDSLIIDDVRFHRDMFRHDVYKAPSKKLFNPKY